MTVARDRYAVCVFCASSEAVGSEDRALAAELGAAIAARGWRLVYGGGNVGLMGEVARAALAAGASVTGVIPHRLADREIALHDVTELVRTETMRQRKDHMDARSDAFIVLPGGIGTLEELVEILTLKQLGYHARPVVILDGRGFWAPLFTLLTRMVEEGFAHEEVLGLFDVAATTEAALAAVEPAAATPSRARLEEELEAVEGPPGEDTRSAGLGTT